MNYLYSGFNDCVISRTHALYYVRNVTKTWNLKIENTLLTFTPSHSVNIQILLTDPHISYSVSWENLFKYKDFGDQLRNSCDMYTRSDNTGRN